LEKIEMKKTLVAVAAMAAVTGAMADVTISGFVDKAVNITSTNNGTQKSTARSLSDNAIGQDQITFGVNEDLGSGMKAYANLSLKPNISTTTLAGDVSQVGIKGAFGDLRVGSDYSTTWYTNNMADASGWGSGAGSVHSVSAVGPVPGVIIYSLPSLTAGLNVTLASVAGGSSTGSGNATAYLLNYTAGGFSIQYAGGSISNPGKYTISDGLGGQTAAKGTTYEDSTGTLRANSTAVTYDFGMAKLYAGYANSKNSGNVNQKSNSYTYGVSAPLGNTPASIGIAMSGATLYSIANTKGLTETGYRILAKYALSKRTALYLQTGKASQTTGTAYSTQQTGLGITHSF
jgi:predicted porin